MLENKAGATVFLYKRWWNETWVDLPLLYRLVLATTRMKTRENARYIKKEKAFGAA